MKYFLFVFASAVAQPIYRNELRHLPEKLKQERIQKTVQDTIHLVQIQIIQAASSNVTETNFTLFCNEPNRMQDISHNGGRDLFVNQGSNYRLIKAGEYPSNSLVPIYPKPCCRIKDGYDLYSIPPQVRTRNPYYPEAPILEEDPVIYIQHFFQKLNMQFPDLSLQISHERKSEGIFENECCPVYIVSW